jgi:glucose uptake protein GlcU
MESYLILAFFALLPILFGFAIGSYRPSESKSQRPQADTKAIVLFVRTDLKMGKGKIGAQCSHAMLKLAR